MSPDRKAVRLADIAEQVQASRRLVEAANMATEDLSREEADALSELLREIVNRLNGVVADLGELRVAA